MKTYVAFLRGINVGGNKLIKMKDLVEIFSSAGLQNVRTFIASGNVLFSSAENNVDKLTLTIENVLHMSFGYEIKVLLRTMDELHEMVESNSYMHKKNGKEKLYVTFIPQKPKETHRFPLRSDKDGFEIIKIHNKEIYWTAFSLANGRNGSLVFPEKEVMKYSTTRNWNTIVRITQLEKK